MKTRIIYTRIWEDEWFCNLSNDGQKLFLYLITNQRINICGIYKVPDRIIYFDTKIRLGRLQKVKNELAESGKVLFYEGWVYVKNAQRLGGYKGEKNEAAADRELGEVPKNIKKCFLMGICDRVSEKGDSVSSIADTSINHKSEIINNKLESSVEYLKNIPKEDIDEFTKKFNVYPEGVKEKGEDFYSYCESKGRDKGYYKNYKAALRNAIKKDYGKRPPAPKPKDPEPEMSEEQKKQNRERIEEMKKGIRQKFKIGK